MGPGSQRVLSSVSSLLGHHWTPLPLNPQGFKPILSAFTTHLQVVLFLNKFFKIVWHKRRNHAYKCFCAFCGAEVYKYLLLCVKEVEDAFSTLARWMVWLEDIFSLSKEILSYLETDVLMLSSRQLRYMDKKRWLLQTQLFNKGDCQGFASGGCILSVFQYNVVHRGKKCSSSEFFRKALV